MELDSVPLSSIEEIATYYLKEIQAFQPEGSYIIGGAGNGGIIALEMAHKLFAKGKCVIGLFLLDTVLPKKFQSLPPKAAQSKVNFLGFLRYFKFFMQRAVIYAKKGKLLSISNIFIFEILCPKLGRRKRRRKNIIRHNRRIQMGVKGFKVYEKIVYAMDRYIPKSYSGKVILFPSERRGGFPEDPRIRIEPWLDFIKGPFKAIVVPGYHLNILKEPNMQYLANQLWRHLYGEPLPNINRN